MEPIDILEMARPEIERRKLFGKVVDKLRVLKKMGMTNDQLLDVIQKMELPLDLHLAITGHFSRLIG